MTCVVPSLCSPTSLQAMASGINLHHKCLRSRLKTFSGYEIATEGDSFKCAFRDPEKAVMWAVMVQVSSGLDAACRRYFKCDWWPYLRKEACCDAR